MSNPLEIFKTHEDRWSWDKYIQQCDLIDLSKHQRQRAKESFAYLRTVLGEGFLRRAENERNPIFLWYFINAAPRKRLALIRLVTALRALTSAPNFHSALRDIKRRIRREDDFERITEKLSIIEIAFKFFEAGFEVEFDPAVSFKSDRGRQESKKPDLRIISTETREDIIVEVSRMKASDHQRLVSGTFATIWHELIEEEMHSDPEAVRNILEPRYILPYAVIHRGIEKDELKKIVGQIREMIEGVRASGRFQELIVPETIELCIAPYDDHSRAKGMGRIAWFKGNGYGYRRADTFR